MYLQPANSSSFPELSIHLTLPPPKPKYPAKQHARNVAKRLPAGDGYIYLEGQRSATFEDSDMPPKFRQRRYFQYLSGVTDIADCALVYSLHTDKLGLFIPPLDPAAVLWSGLPRSREECAALYDVDAVHTTADLAAHLRTLHRTRPAAPFYTIHDQRPPRDVGGIIIENTLLQPAINDCRVYKDAYELALLRRANEISAAAHIATMRAARTARNEAELEAVFVAACVARQAKTQAYDPIMCSGRNAATLHYTKNDEPLAGRQLLLCDASAEWQGYAADVTRTYPLSGQWSTEAAAVYRIVEEMQRATIAITVKGVDWRETHLLAHRIATRGLLELGILKGGTEEEIFAAGTSKAFYPHGLGHFVGLDVHDVEGTPDLPSVDMGAYATLAPLAAFNAWLGRGRGRRAVSHTLVNRVLDTDMVITVEPGIYFCRFLIEPYLTDPVHGKFIDERVLERYWDVGGVRIEDDVLVLEEGNENITTAPAGEEMMRIVRGEE
ncbi:putative Xaa-Pro aminopeptidase [Geopyxis carbonaria]|nr:putative Xaa-Pro aminopeptidase [Geopyxis carbonaria]